MGTATYLAIVIETYRIYRRSVFFLCQKQCSLCPMTWLRQSLAKTFLTHYSLLSTLLINEGKRIRDRVKLVNQRPSTSGMENIGRLITSTKFFYNS